MTTIQAWAALNAGDAFTPFEYDPGPLDADEVEIAVDYCGLCHSDYSVWKNEWGVSRFPFVGGHEIVGRVVALGESAKGLKIGDRVGLGWFARSDLTTLESIGGDHNLSPGNQPTIVGRYGGFAERVRCQWVWATPLPDDLSVESAGPLFCGGITVFNPIIEFGVKPTDRVGVIGIGGLGHLAIQFLNKWGCEVTAFTSTPEKAEEAKSFGAHKILSSRDPDEWAASSRYFDLIMSTVAVDMDWALVSMMLAPRGRLHMVGISPSPVALPAFVMISEQRAFSGSPLGAPDTTRRMLEFCARHDIKPKIEVFPMSKINEAMKHLEDGNARYRIVLENDFEDRPN
ncbi:MAG: NAD(P)-dependent alcohol dehydrogenase [Pseudomonadota bacterium]